MRRLGKAVIVTSGAAIAYGIGWRSHYRQSDPGSADQWTTAAMFSIAVTAGIVAHLALRPVAKKGHIQFWLVWLLTGAIIGIAGSIAGSALTDRSHSDVDWLGIGLAAFVALGAGLQEWIWRGKSYPR